MTAAERVLAHFDRISEAPDAVARLRRFILDLAVRGKLVDQDPLDEPASELLRRIATEKAQLAKRGEGRQGDAHSGNRDGVPYELPSLWMWAQIEAVAYVEMGQSPPSEHYNQHGDGIAFFQGKADFGDRSPIPRYWCTQPTKMAEPGDILISVRAPVGPTNVADQSCCIGRGLAALRPYHGLDREFLLLCLRAFESDLASLGFGTTLVAINKGQLTAFPLPLPPVAEQHRIVAKVDELMVLCDRLEAAQKEREIRRDRLVSASLARLNQPADSPSFREHARFHLQHLPRMTTSRAHIQQLRQTILNVAVFGHLTKQDPDDASGFRLLASLQEKARAKRRAPSVQQVADSATVQALRPTWARIKLGGICELVTSGSRGWAEFYSEVGAKFIRAQNIRFGKLRVNDLAYVTPRKTTEGTRTRISRGDLLIVITGAGVTNPALVEEDLGEAYVSQHVALVRPAAESVSPWILLCLMAEAAGRATLVERAYGAGKPGLNLETIRALEIPFPPLQEQRRILDRVGELMSVCGRLEAQLEAGRAVRGALLEATLREVLTDCEQASMIATELG